MHPHLGTPPAGHVTHGRHRSAPVLIAALAPVAIVACLVLTPTMAGAATAAAAQITQPGRTAQLKSGGSATPFAVTLPAGASCPGDTAHDGYHVDSYLVPKGVSPTSVDFKTGYPSKWYGYIDYGDFYAANNTDEGTGQLMALPYEFSFSRYSSYMDDLFPDGVKSATWEGGIVCANTHGEVTNYWNSEFVFTKSASDPGGFVWKVVDAPPPVSSSSHTALWVGVTLLGLAVIFAITAIVLNRRRPDEGDGGSADLPVESPLEPTAAGR